MNTHCSARNLAVVLAKGRSQHKVSVAAVLSDNYGIFAWGWNNPGRNGNGEHAEEAVFRRANKKRLQGAILTVAGIRRRRGKFFKFVFAKPCNERCFNLARKYCIKIIECTTKETNIWKVIKL